MHVIRKIQLPITGNWLTPNFPIQPEIQLNIPNQYAFLCGNIISLGIDIWIEVNASHPMELCKLKFFQDSEMLPETGKAYLFTIFSPHGLALHLYRI